jgi:hypothetical protein
MHAGVQLPELGIDVAIDDDVRASRKCAREIVDGTCKAEVVEGLGAQFLRDSANLVEVRANRFLCFLERSSLGRGSVLSELLQEQEHAGHRLPNLVMEPARDPLPFVLSSLQRPGAGLATFGFEALDHPIEGSLERADFAGARGTQGPNSPQDIEFLHATGKPLERRKQGSQEQQVGNQHDHDADREHDPLDQADVGTDADRCERQHQNARDQKRGIHKEHAPEKRHWHMP